MRGMACGVWVSALRLKPYGCMQRVQAGELLLMDAGCELHGYSSDVTRTWPVSGTFSRHQREVYEIVLDTHRCATARDTTLSRLCVWESRLHLHWVQHWRLEFTMSVIGMRDGQY